MQRHGRQCNLHSYVSGQAESAIRVRQIVVRVNVGNLNRAEEKDQDDA